MYFRRLRDLREDRDLKQTDVAALLGIRQTVYSRYERGYQNLPLEHLLALADYYGVSTDYILAAPTTPKQIHNHRSKPPFPVAFLLG